MILTRVQPNVIATGSFMIHDGYRRALGGDGFNMDDRTNPE